MTVSRGSKACSHTGSDIIKSCDGPGQCKDIPEAEQPHKHAIGPKWAASESSFPHPQAFLPGPSQPGPSPDQWSWTDSCWAPSAAAHVSVGGNICMSQVGNIFDYIFKFCFQTFLHWRYRVLISRKLKFTVCVMWVHQLGVIAEQLQLSLRNHHYLIIPCKLWVMLRGKPIRLNNASAEGGPRNANLLLLVSGRCSSEVFLWVWI